MTHPITPPPELVQQWEAETAHTTKDEIWHVAVQAAQWGADQELEACCEWLASKVMSERNYPELRAARRPKLLSLKEQALDVLHLSFDRGYLKEEAADTIRRALEQLDD
jgi:hypothetical protein